MDHSSRDFSRLRISSMPVPQTKADSTHLMISGGREVGSLSKLFVKRAFANFRGKKRAFANFCHTTAVSPNFCDKKDRLVKMYYLQTRNLGARWAPISATLLALRACLTSSFTPFGHSSRVTHADDKFTSVLEQVRFQERGEQCHFGSFWVILDHFGSFWVIWLNFGCKSIIFTVL